MQKDKKLRNYIKERMMQEIELVEFDLIVPKKKEWQREAQELRSDLVELLKNIENDDYAQGVEKIDDAISKLSSWKKKIQKFL